MDSAADGAPAETARRSHTADAEAGASPVEQLAPDAAMGALDAGGAAPARDAGTLDGAATDASVTAVADAAPPASAEAAPGTLYARCESDDGCDEGLACAPMRFVGVGYCTRACEAGAPCPAPSSGDVGAVCDAALDLCLLTSCLERECPRGMSCLDATVVVGARQTTVRYCAYPR